MKKSHSNFDLSKSYFAVDPKQQAAE